MAENRPVSVLLYGPGGIGAFYAFILGRCANVQVTVVARGNYDAIKTGGIRLTSPNHGDHTFHPHAVLKSPSEATQTFDYIVCAQKAVDLPSDAEALSPTIHPTASTIVLIQNGVGNEDPFRSRFPSAPIISCVTWTGCSQPEPGLIKHTLWEDMEIGAYLPPHPAGSTSPRPKASDTETKALDGFAAMLKEGGTKFRIVDDIQLLRWRKLVSNAVWNPLTALTDLQTHGWFAPAPTEAERLPRAIFGEVMAVAAAEGYTLDPGLPDELLELIQSKPSVNSSMQNDMLAKKPMEVEVILGHPVRRGRELGVPTPVLETLYALLTAWNWKFMGGKVEAKSS